MAVRLSYSVARLICEDPDAVRSQQTTIGADLGVNTLIAAIDGQRVILFSGRTGKASLQYRNNQLVRFQHTLSRTEQESRRHKRLQRRKYAMLSKTARRVCNVCHTASGGGKRRHLLRR
jgi:transposase